MDCGNCEYLCKEGYLDQRCDKYFPDYERCDQCVDVLIRELKARCAGIGKAIDDWTNTEVLARLEEGHRGCEKGGLAKAITDHILEGLTKGK